MKASRCATRVVSDFKTEIPAKYRVDEYVVSPLSGRGSVEIAVQIHEEDGHANEHRAAYDEPLRQIGIHDCVENTQKKWAARGFDASASLKPGFGDGKRARRPGN